MEYTSTADAVAAHVESAKSDLNIERIEFANYSNNKINWSGYKVIRNETKGKKIDIFYILVQKSNEMVYVIGGSTKIDDERRLSSILEKLLSTFKTVGVGH